MIGVERSEAQLAEARRLAELAGERDAIEFRQGDATRLPLRSEEWATFDVAHTRFLLEHVTDPAAVVREMLRAVKPGGRIVLEDDGHDVLRLWPEPPGFGRLWQCYLRSYDRIGCDPFVGHRLVSLLHSAGAEPTRNTWLFFGAARGSPNCCEPTWTISRGFSREYASRFSTSGISTRTLSTVSSRRSGTGEHGPMRQSGMPSRGPKVGVRWLDSACHATAPSWVRIFCSTPAEVLPSASAS